MKRCAEPRDRLANKPLLQRVVLFPAGPLFNIDLAVASVAVAGVAPGWSGNPLDVVAKTVRGGAAMGRDARPTTKRGAAHRPDRP